MPYITIQVSPQGLVCDAFVHVSKARREALLAAKQPVPPAQRIRALVDTGASCTCIDPSYATALGLTPKGAKVQIDTASTAGTPFEADQYDISLIILNPDPNDYPLIRPTIPASGMELLDLGLDALIGRDVLSGCMLVYDGKNEQFSIVY